MLELIAVAATEVAKTPVTEKSVSLIEKSIAGGLESHWVLIAILFLVFILAILVLVFRGNLKLKLPGGTEMDIGAGGEGGKKDLKKEVKKDDNGDKKQTISDSNLLRTRTISAHALCPRVIDFKHVVSKTISVVSKISEIRYRGCLSEQMGYAEEQFINIRTNFQRVFLDKFREKLQDTNKPKEKSEDQYLYEDYRYYQAVVKLMLHDMASVIRASFTNNHLINYTPSEYQNYIELKFSVIKGIEADYIDTMYIGDWILSRNEIFDMHRQVRADFRAIVQDIYLNAQRISSTKEAEVIALEKELQNYLEVTVSDEIVVEKTVS